jgi:hypothetical protein
MPEELTAAGTVADFHGIPILIHPEYPVLEPKARQI